MGLLADKVAIITGATSGIGLAAARIFGLQGAKLVLNGRNAEKLDALVRDFDEHGQAAVGICGDIREEETHRRLVQTAMGEFGQLNVALNNAGTVGALKPLAEIDAEEWDDVIGTNLTAAFYGARHQIPAMLANAGGSIIFTSSFVGSSVGLPGMGAYAASKAALTGLVKGIAADYGAMGIRANVLLPGGTDTPMAGGPDQKAWAAGLHAMKRIAQPEEIANAALFLASDLASFVSGSSLWADGGNSAVK